ARLPVPPSEHTAESNNRLISGFNYNYILLTYQQSIKKNTPPLSTIDLGYYFLMFFKKQARRHRQKYQQ
ncbi:MAG: hypothetical protein WCQ71_03885, partial [Bacilli bacterium]